MPSLEELQTHTCAIPAAGIWSDSFGNFDPPERIATKLISDYCSGDCSVGDLADRAQTTIEALSQWLARPDIESRLSAIESTFSRRCRLQLANNTNGIIKACNAAIDNYIHSESRLLFRESDLRGHELMARKTSNALLAGRMLMHLAKLHSDRSTNRGSRSTPQPAPPAPTSGPDHDHAPAPDLQAERAKRRDRFDLLPRFPDLPDLIRDGYPLAPATPNPTRDNTSSAPCAAGSPRFAATGLVPVTVPRVADTITGPTESLALIPTPAHNEHDATTATRVETQTAPIAPESTADSSSPARETGPRWLPDAQHLVPASEVPIARETGERTTRKRPCSTCGPNPCHSCSSVALPSAARARDPTHAHA